MAESMYRRLAALDRLESHPLAACNPYPMKPQTSLSSLPSSKTETPLVTVTLPSITAVSQALR